MDKKFRIIDLLKIKNGEKLFLYFLYFFFTISNLTSAEEIESGVIAIASSPIKVINSRGVVREAKMGDKIYLNDTIQTDAKGKVQILLNDQTAFNLGPNSSIVLEIGRAHV